MTRLSLGRKGQGNVEYVLIAILVGMLCLMALTHGGDRVVWLWANNCEKISAVAAGAPAATPPPAGR